MRKLWEMLSSMLKEHQAKHLIRKEVQGMKRLEGWCYTQDGPAYNPSGYTQDSNLTNPKPT